MDLADLLPWSRATPEHDRDVETLRGWLASAIVLARAEVFEGADRQLLEKHFADLPPNEAVRLISSITTKPADVCRRLETIRREHGLPGGSASEIYIGLTSIQKQIEQSIRQRRLWSATVTVLKAVAYAGPVVVAYLVGTYFRFYNNVYWDSDTVLSPAGMYSYRGDNYSIPEDYQIRFFKEFSKYYFRRESSFGAQFVRNQLPDLATEPADPTYNRQSGSVPDSPAQSAPIGSGLSLDDIDRYRIDSLKLRVVFRNPRGAEPLLISAVEAIATYDKKPFDWSRVDVTTDLDVSVVDEYGSPDSVELKSSGIGPATNVQYTISARDLTLNRAHFEYILNVPSVVYLAQAASTDDIVSLRAFGELLDPPIYWKLSATPSETSETSTKSPEFLGSSRRAYTSSGNIVRCADGREFERVTNVNRLSGLTKTVQGGPATVDVTFESLRGEKASKAIVATLPDDTVFAVGVKRIERSNPCVPVPPPPPPPPLPPFGPAKWVDTLTGAQKSLKGVDLIKAAVTLDMRNLPDGSVAALTTQPDEILNPAGFLMLDVTVRNASNGNVRLAISVNGVNLREMTVQMLVPDDMSFEPVSPEKMGHFRQQESK